MKRITDRLLEELGFQSGYNDLAEDEYDEQYYYMDDRDEGDYDSFVGISLAAYKCKEQPSYPDLESSPIEPWWDEKDDWYVVYELWESGMDEDEKITDGDRLIEVIKAAKDFRKVIKRGRE
jgi:hypothetical protein